MIDNIMDQLRRDEGERLYVYPDSKGIPTAGVGHNLPAHGITLPLGTPITQAQSDQWLLADVMAVNLDLRKNAAWVFDISVVRRGVLQNMCFNMGWGNGIKGLSSFTTFLGLVESKQYDAASDDEIHTLWARQVGARATRLALQMRTGQWQ